MLEFFFSGGGGCEGLNSFFSFILKETFLSPLVIISKSVALFHRLLFYMF